MCTDACLARDQARQALAAREADLAKARAERETEKQAVNTLAEERRRQFEAMEKRLRLASAGVEKHTRGALSKMRTRRGRQKHDVALLAKFGCWLVSFVVLSYLTCSVFLFLVSVFLFSVSNVDCTQQTKARRRRAKKSWRHTTRLCDVSAMPLARPTLARLSSGF